MSARNWCYTLNNPTDEEIELVDKIVCRYHIYGYEIGENETPHLQGYIEFDKVVRLSGMKKLIARAHFEQRRGTREQAREYCMKDGTFFEFGDFGGIKPGKRTDIEEMVQAIKDGARPIDLIETMPVAVARNLKFMDRTLELIEKESTRDFRKVDVIVLWGAAGTGKTREVFKRHPKVFTVNSGEAFPFNGYDGETEIVLDDFYGGIPYHELLRVLDGYQYRVNVKGGHRYARWTTVYITSNKPPEQWYQVGLTDALKRRLTSVTVTEVPGNTGAGTGVTKDPEDNIENDIDI